MTIAPPNVNAAWSTREAVKACGCDSSDPVLIDRMLLIASNLLYRESGHLWPGVGSDLVRPCAGSATSEGGVPTWHAQPLASTFLGFGYAAYGGLPWTWLPGWGSCGCSGSISRSECCHGPSELQLPGWPVQSITAVTIDGVDLDPAAYRIDDEGWLTRLPDPDDPDHRKRRWPCCQRLDLPLTEPDTFGVAYTYGQEPPEDGKWAAEQLTAELVAWGACGDCNLNNEHLAALQREGISFEIANANEIGITNVSAVRLFLDSVNPKNSSGQRVRQPARAWSPDVKRHFRRTGTPEV